MSKKLEAAISELEHSSEGHEVPKVVAALKEVVAALKKTPAEKAPAKK